MMIQSIQMALKAIAGNKLRSFLTMLGVIIGVISVVVLVSIGQGTTASVTSSIESLGTNLLTANIRSYRANTITLASLEQLAVDEPSIQHIAPTIQQSGTEKAGSTTYTDGVIVATVPSYLTIRDMYVQEGRFITQPDLDNRSFVAVIGSEVATELFGSYNVIGQTFRFNGYDFTVVGLMQSKGTSSSGSNDTQIIIPFTLGQRIFNQPTIRSFYASAASPDDVAEAQFVLETYLGGQFKNDTTAYTLFNQSDMLETVASTADTLALMLGGIAAISLLVGGIGIMNIMLVSVSERTREIGIRKAIGATRGRILLQFLIEALVISGMGGLIGLVLALLTNRLLGPVLNMTLTMAPTIAWLSIGFSLVIGMVFGLYPANKASKLRPIEALRYEA